MGNNPWDANEGKYDVPTSSIPKARSAPRTAADMRGVDKMIRATLDDPPERYHGVQPVKVKPIGKRLRK